MIFALFKNNKAKEDSTETITDLANNSTFIPEATVVVDTTDVETEQKQSFINTEISNEVEMEVVKPINYIPIFYVSLLSAQFFGRLAWGLMAYFISVFDKNHEFFVEMVMTATISGSLLGIGIQLLLIPPVVYAMQRARFI